MCVHISFIYFIYLIVATPFLIPIKLFLPNPQLWFKWGETLSLTYLYNIKRTFNILDLDELTEVFYLNNIPLELVKLFYYHN